MSHLISLYSCLTASQGWPQWRVGHFVLRLTITAGNALKERCKDDRGYCPVPPAGGHNRATTAEWVNIPGRAEWSLARAAEMG